MIAFKFEDVRFALEPKTAFYDWLYVNAIFPHREWLTRLSRYQGFTDIEFNPDVRSIVSTVMCLVRGAECKNVLEDALGSPEAFIDIITSHSYQPHLRRTDERAQTEFFKS